MLLAQGAYEGRIPQWLGGEVRGITQSLTWWGPPTLIDLMEAKGVIETSGQDGARWLQIPMELAREYPENPELAGNYWVLLTEKE